jgi:hypothetical protein
LFVTESCPVGIEPGLCSTGARGFRHPFSENAGQNLFANKPDVLFLIPYNLLFAFTRYEVLFSYESCYGLKFYAIRFACGFALMLLSIQAE